MEANVDKWGKKKFNLQAELFIPFRIKRRILDRRGSNKLGRKSRIDAVPMFTMSTASTASDAVVGAAGSVTIDVASCGMVDGSRNITAAGWTDMLFAFEAQAETGMLLEAVDLDQVDQ